MAASAKRSRSEPSLAASWILDKERSGSMSPYLQLMGLSELAIEAWIKAERETDTFKVIDFIPAPPAKAKGVRIMKRDRVQNNTEVSLVLPT